MGRIFPVAVKPPSQYTIWEAWPRDVVKTLWALNHSGGSHSELTFRRSSATFKCVDCGAFCAAHSCGACVLQKQKYMRTNHDGEMKWRDDSTETWLCDDCMIERARRTPWLDHPDQVQLLWSIGFWDGTLSGICTYQGREHYYTLVGDEIARRRVYGVVALSDEEITEFTRQHQYFEDTVGRHTSYVYDAEGVPRRRAGFSAATKPDWHDFYDKPLEPLVDLAPAKERQPVGLFSIGTFQFPAWMQ